DGEFVAVVAVPVEHGSRLVVVDAEPGADRFRVVVFATHQGAAALLANVADVAARVRRLAVLTHGSVAQSADDLFVVDVECQGGVELLSERGEHSLEPFGLRYSAHGAVEDDAFLVLWLGELLAEDAEDDGIPYELATIHIAFRLEAELRAGAFRGSEDIPGCERGHVKLFGEERGLGALSCAGFAEEDEDHRGGKSTRNLVGVGM